MKMDIRTKLSTCNIEDIDYISLFGIATYARLIDVYDGDTITCIIPFLDKLYKFKVRINGIDTCEIRNKNLEEKYKAIQAKNRVVEILSGNEGIIWLECHHFDKYGRLLADVYNETKEKCVSKILLDEKLANPYSGGTKQEFILE